MKTVADALSCGDIAPFEARVLLERVSGIARVSLIARPEAVLSDAQAAAFLAAVDRRRAGTPIAYLVGERDFHGITLQVTPDVLIPRPETELLVDFALERLPPGGAMLDLGTGSGAIALAVKHARPDVQVKAVDRSAAALAIARVNATRLGLAVDFVEGNWFEPLGSQRFAVIVSNPPYVAEGDRHLSQGDLRFEPKCALVGGADGLAAIRSICADAPRHLQTGGWLCVEHGAGQELSVRKLFERAGLESVESRPDLAGTARVVIGRQG